jgi:hypothetical protein
VLPEYESLPHTGAVDGSATSANLPIVEEIQADGEVALLYDEFRSRFCMAARSHRSNGSSLRAAPTAARSHSSTAPQAPSIRRLPLTGATTTTSSSA